MNLSFVEKVIVVMIAVVAVFCAFFRYKSNNATEIVAEKNPAVDLGMTIEKFCEKYNVAILTVDSRLRQCTINPDKEKFEMYGNKKTFLHFFPDGVNMRGEIDLRTNRLTKIEIGCDVYHSRITEWLHSAIYDAAIATVSPNLTATERAEIIDAVEYETYTRKGSPIVVDGITFHTSRYKGFVTSTIAPLN